jgi:hypothetical protein
MAVLSTLVPPSQSSHEYHDGLSGRLLSLTSVFVAWAFCISSRFCHGKHGVSGKGI